MSDFYIELVRGDDVPGVFPKRHPYTLEEFTIFVENSGNYMYYFDFPCYKGGVDPLLGYVPLIRKDSAYFNHSENMIDGLKYCIEIQLSNTGSILYY